MSSKLCLEGNSNKYLIQLSETYTSFDWKTESSAGLNWTRQNMVFKLFWVACNKTLMTSRNITLITLFSYSLHFPIGKMTLGGVVKRRSCRKQITFSVVRVLSCKKIDKTSSFKTSTHASSTQQKKVAISQQESYKHIHLSHICCNAWLMTNIPQHLALDATYFGSGQPTERMSFERVGWWGTYYWVFDPPIIPHQVMEEVIYYVLKKRALI